MVSASKCLSNANTEDIPNGSFFYSEDSNSDPDKKEIKE
jgi:hypothetical protein